ncbi:DUF1203 domain-containing protein [Sphingomonas sp. CGMCC 1.13654]|uniref:DUF1203 domain-containing protein n=1 Tax=Sphingomonas chungangi TaxID=2683589 RepID=A0A838LB32_9SPHN|nr:DUF1203 domain-containing protein [Sphingomonas chungangi]MBA2936070.1 DUF1203 domain-containing protein [Sphingomonas chungangi]MVW55459.1 DUF1203 domain-containing protein [Sphingomonas chungangi]
MTYRIQGLDPARFADAEALIAEGAIRMKADSESGYPCRVTLQDAEPGENVLLLNYLHADVQTPFRARHAIFVREGAVAASHYEDVAPPYLEQRPLSLRGFDGAGMILVASTAEPGGADAGIRGLLENGEIDYVDVHHAAWGCFLARAERSGHA